jgi:hypothetical protein
MIITIRLTRDVSCVRVSLHRARKSHLRHRSTEKRMLTARAQETYNNNDTRLTARVYVYYCVHGVRATTEMVDDVLKNKL